MWNGENHTIDDVTQEHFCPWLYSVLLDSVVRVSASLSLCDGLTSATCGQDDPLAYQVITSHEFAHPVEGNCQSSSVFRFSREHL